MTVHLRLHTEKEGMLEGVYPEAFQFPGGEWHLRDIPEIPLDQGAVTFIADWRGADLNDLVKAALWADVARRNIDSWDTRFVLMMPYTPAARADRGVPLGVSVYSRLVRSLNADRIITLDPHSPQTERSYVLSSMRVADVLPLIKEALYSDKPWNGVISPDKGAVNRAGHVAEQLGVPLVVADKTRDFDTGKIIDLTIPELDPWGRYLVVDDICDGGGTFTLLASKTGLPKEQLGLWVAHGIFSGNARLLRQHYGWIGTTDSHPGCFQLGVATVVVPCFSTMYAEMRKS